jgi:hypothetical protein
MNSNNPIGNNQLWLRVSGRVSGVGPKQLADINNNFARTRADIEITPCFSGLKSGVQVA